MFNYFFGSDFRSVEYLRVLYKNNVNIKVVTLNPKPTGRGQQTKANPVEVFANKHNIPFEYFAKDAVYKDMTKGLCVSFGKIFTSSFLNRNNPIFNVHLSLLPMYKGPSPVETTILQREKIAGISIFNINPEIDGGDIVYRNSFKISESTYASDIYSEAINIFTNEFNKIVESISKLSLEDNLEISHTDKFIKNDFSITNKTVSEAKRMIRAFDVIGPAFCIVNDKLFKIHAYTETPNKLPIQLIDGILYPSLITPAGKKKMKTEDYIRGNL